MSICWDVLGVGVVAVDDLYFVDQHPRPDTKQRIAGKRRQGGGNAATAMVAAARLGARVAVCAILGDDDLCRYSLAELEREGVDCSTIVRRAGASPYHSIVLVETRSGKRSILYCDEGVTHPGPDDLTSDLIDKCRVFFIDQKAARTALHAIALAKAGGVPVVADVEELETDADHALLHRADHLIVGQAVARCATGETSPARMAAALGEGRACCVVTAGERGCWYTVNGSQVEHCPALPVKVVDTTGCGDVFHGAYTAAVAARETSEKAVRIASIAAGLKATQPGGRAGIPGLAVINEYLEGQYLAQFSRHEYLTED